MAYTTPLSLILLFFLLSTQTQAQAPGPAAPAGPINITAILEKGGQFTKFIRMLNQTQAANQINTQANSSTVGMTVLAPTDNAFDNLPAGTLNNLNSNQQVQLVQYHVLPQYYSLTDLLTVSNPVRTQATGQDGGVFGLNFTGQGSSQVNVSSGVVTTQINNVLSKDRPLAVYQVDKVLLPKEFYEAKAPAAAPPKGSSTGKVNGTTPASADAQPSSPSNGSRRMTVGLSLVGGLWLFCMGILA